MSANPAAKGDEKAAASAQTDCTRTLAGRRSTSRRSGGKDAYLAFARAVAAGGRPGALVCMLHEDGDRSRGHGLPVALLEAQVEALGIPLVTRATTWDDYEATYVSVLHELRAQGVEAGVFGDIDLEGHRVWVEGVCDVAGLSCHLPLWQEPRRRLIGELLAGGGRGTPGAGDAPRRDAQLLGRELTAELVAELEAAGADGEGDLGVGRGEAHDARRRLLQRDARAGAVGHG